MSQTRAKSSTSAHWALKIHSWTADWKRRRKERNCVDQFACLRAVSVSDMNTASNRTEDVWGSQHGAEQRDDLEVRDDCQAKRRRQTEE